MMSDEHRDAIRQANRRRGNCGKCGSVHVEIRDGSEIGGFPGLKYRYCGACGWSRAITSRPRKSDGLRVKP